MMKRLQRARASRLLFRASLILSLVLSRNEASALTFDSKEGLLSPLRGVLHEATKRRAWGWLSWRRQKRPHPALTQGDGRYKDDDNDAKATQDDTGVDGALPESPLTATSKSGSAVLVRREQQEQESQNEKNNNSLSVASILAGLAKIVQNPRVRVWAASGLQIGLIAYLAHAIWQSAAEVLDDYYKEITGAEQPFCSPEKVAHFVQLMEQDPALVQTALERKQEQLLPPLVLLSLARQLLLSGMPLRGSSHTSGASVESVLMSLNRSEVALLQQCLWTPPFAASSSPSNHHSDSTYQAAAAASVWHGIAGLHNVKLRLLDSVASMVRRDNVNPADQQTHHHHHFQAYSSLFHDAGGASGGILFYGPPGCGKTMLMKALAATTRLPCLIVAPSTLLRKYVGDTNLSVRSLFSLVHKLAPCVLCMDELDGLFRERNDNEHETSRDLKTEFLQWWDGMISATTTSKGDSSQHQRVLVIGATNRPWDVDSAVLRRLPLAFFIGLPDAVARAELLSKLVKSIPTEEDFDIDHISSRTDGYSPSDLRQVLQTAALSGPLRDAQLQQLTATISPSSQRHRPLSTVDVLRALEMVRPTPLTSQYRSALKSFSGTHMTVPQVTQTSGSDGFGKWESSWGDFYDAGTLELDHETLDLLTDIANEMESLSDERENDESDDLD